MGYSTLPGFGCAPLADLIAADLGEPVILQDVRGDTVHTLIRRPSGHGAFWVVSLVRGGMVKHLDEACGPYCEPCSKAFLGKALELCSDAPTPYAVAFRDRMTKALVA